MALNKQKKVEYIRQILDEVKNGTIDGDEDSILVFLFDSDEFL